MTKQRQFTPDWDLHVGDSLADYLDAYHMTQVELADRTGLHIKTINEIINGKAPLTPATALLLERYLIGLRVFGWPSSKAIKIVRRAVLGNNTLRHTTIG